MARYSLIIVALAVILAHGTVHGLWTGRWADAKTATAWAEKLQNVPVSLPNWTSEEMEIDEKMITFSQLTGYFSRKYVHRQTGEQVSVLIVCGPPGPASVHTPDVCYRGAGYAPGPITNEEMAVGENTPPLGFFTAVFSKPVPTGTDRLQIYWGWGAAGSWKAPTFPRLAFGTQPALYKMYVIRQLPRTDDGAAQANPCVDLMRELAPELQRTLFKAS